jgi:gamma-glutamyl-gamma-aminobutyrate hydrolase PuuD
MTKPVIGVIGNAYSVENRFTVQMVGERNMRALKEVAGGIPLMFAGNPEITDIDDLIDTVDGVLLTGARANVHPRRFNTEPDPKHEPYDEDRDAVALPLIEACVARSLPVFGICRGFQEMNVAFGGSLHPEQRVIAEGVAEDGTIEAIRIEDAPGFALGVQWHAEYDPERNPINRALFEAFGDAVRAYRRGKAQRSVA